MKLISQSRKKDKEKMLLSGEHTAQSTARRWVELSGLGAYKICSERKPNQALGQDDKKYLRFYKNEE